MIAPAVAPIAAASLASKRRMATRSVTCQRPAQAQLADPFEKLGADVPGISRGAQALALVGKLGVRGAGAVLVGEGAAGKGGEHGAACRLQAGAASPLPPAPVARVPV